MIQVFCFNIPVSRFCMMLYDECLVLFVRLTVFFLSDFSLSFNVWGASVDWDGHGFEASLGS